MQILTKISASATLILLTALLIKYCVTMNRLFGKSKKQPASQFQEQPDNSGEEDSGFTVVAAPEQPATVSTTSSTAYSYGTPSATSPPYAVSGSQAQVPASAKPPVHYLDGIPFVLGGGCGETDLDATLARAEAATNRLKSVNWGAYEYDFGLEKSVIEQDITATMKRCGYMSITSI